ncbi:MAG: DUF2071 domain-containing protein [Ornithinimicrobium sp.]
MSQVWEDIAFLHWRVDASLLQPLMPDGARPDLHDGSGWVGLLPFRMRGAGFGDGPAIPWFGTFWETNVRVYSTDARGRRGVVFLSLEAQRLAVVLGARLSLGVPYFWSRMSGDQTSRATMHYRTRRLTCCAEAPPGSRIDLRVGRPITKPGATARFLSARFGLHTQVAGRGVWVPNTHRPWPLRRAEVTGLHDELIVATGLPDLPAERAPDHVMFSRGVRTQFGRPQLTCPATGGR